MYALRSKHNPNEYLRGIDVKRRLPIETNFEQLAFMRPSLWRCLNEIKRYANSIALVARDFEIVEVDLVVKGVVE